MNNLELVMNKIKYIVLNSFDQVYLDPSSLWFRLALLLLAVMIFSYFVNLLLMNSVLGPRYRIFVAPGIILHELSHALFCILTGAKIKKLSFFDKDGGSVEHEKSKLPVLGPLLISFAPFVFGIVFIFFAARWLGLKDIDLSALKLDFNNIYSFVKSIFSGIDYKNYLNIVILYLTLSVAVTMTPSKQDIKNIALLLVLIVLIAAAFLYFHWSLNLSFIPIGRAVLLLNTVVVLLILSALLSMIIFAFSKFVKK